MGDRWVLALAAAVVAGATVARAAPVGVVAVVLAVGAIGAVTARTHPVVVVVGAALLASWLGARAWDGLDAAPVGSVEGWADVLSDPVWVQGALRVDLRVGEAHVEAWARGSAADALAGRVAGDQVAVRGTARRPPPSAITRLAARHIGARLTVSEVEAWRSGPWWARAANSVRKLVADGAALIGPERAPLYTGMVDGDDRDLPTEVVDDFRGAGLSHLTAVSGQNVAFVLVLAGPLLRRCGLRVRWLLTLVLIVGFATVTRFEPSVLRASAMAAVVATASGLGWPQSRVRLVALAVVGLVLVDPMLVRSVGFQLSVGATLGLAVLAEPIGARLPGPRWLAEALAVTVAAQLGVAPVSLAVFGPMPLASIPANVLAVPAAGPIMMWGLTGGVVAGRLGPDVGAAIQWPVGQLVGWVAAVARWGAHLPLGQVRWWQLVVVVVLVAAGRRLGRSPRTVAGATASATAAVLLGPLLVAPSDLGGAEVARGAWAWRHHGVAVVVVDGADAAAVLSGLRTADIDRVDLVVCLEGGRRAAEAVWVVRSRVPVGAIVAPIGHQIRDATGLLPGAEVAIGPLIVTMPGSEGGEVEVTRGPPDPGG